MSHKKQKTASLKYFLQITQGFRPFRDIISDMMALEMAADDFLKTGYYEGLVMVSKELYETANGILSVTNAQEIDTNLAFMAWQRRTLGWKEGWGV